MVYKLVKKSICILLLFSIPAQAADPTLILKWQGQKNRACQHLVENFLAELRSIASDWDIELEAVSNPSRRTPARQNSSSEIGDARILKMSCDKSLFQAPTNTLEITDSNNSSAPLKMHWLAKAQGFAATDWLPFQKRYLETMPNIAPPLPKLISNENKPSPALETSTAPMVDSSENHVPLVNHWWFWAIVGGVATGSIYAITQVAGNNSDGSSTNVEIH